MARITTRMKIVIVAALIVLVVGALVIVPRAKPKAAISAECVGWADKKTAILLVTNHTRGRVWHGTLNDPIPPL